MIIFEQEGKTQHNITNACSTLNIEYSQSTQCKKKIKNVVYYLQSILFVHPRKCNSRCASTAEEMGSLCHRGKWALESGQSVVLIELKAMLQLKCCFEIEGISLKI